MKEIVKYISYLMAVVGLAAVIWRVAISFQAGLTKDTLLEYDISHIKEDMVTKDDLRIFADSLHRYNIRMESKMNDVTEGLDNFRRSYVTRLKDEVNDSVLTFPKFVQYMEELKKKEEQQLMDQVIEYNIRHEKIEKK